MRVISKSTELNTQHPGVGVLCTAMLFVACAGPQRPAVLPLPTQRSVPPSMAPQSPGQSTTDFSTVDNDATGPLPLLAAGQPVTWWFAFKFNADTYAGCTAAKACPFGGTPQIYHYGEGEQYAFASSEFPQLQLGSACIGETAGDPLGATFGQIYNGRFFYVVWNDQFYDDPKIIGCSTSCSVPWGHSKGIVAWGANGDGLVMQVTTPSWPASGSSAYPRNSDGNTLGCIKDDNVLVSQHFFAVQLSHVDTVKMLDALRNASVVTDPSNPQIVNNGGPADIATVVNSLGRRSESRAVTKVLLSSGITLISKPSALHVPPWQMVSAVMGGISLRVASWWQPNPHYKPIPSTTATTPIDCWDSALPKSGAVEIAISGSWDGKAIGLTGGLGGAFNHAKIGVGIEEGSPDVVLGDLNQAGSLADNCEASQNGRGGLFFALRDHAFHQAVRDLLNGESAASVPVGSREHCCKRCSESKACGDSCIPTSATCSRPIGCACDARQR